MFPRGTLGLMHRVKVRRVDDEVPVYDSGLVRSRSWVKNFARILGVNLASYSTGATGVVSWGGTDLAGGIRRYDGAWVASNYAVYTGSYPALQLHSPPSQAVYGILVGTGVGAPALSDYTLGTLIDHGGGAGALSYADTVVESVVEDGVTIDLLIWRSFSNTSGGSITVNEIGLMAKHYYANSWSYFLIARDLLNFSIADGESATVEYVVRIS